MKRIFIGVLVCLFYSAAPVFSEGTVEGLKDFQYWENGKIKQCTAYDVNGHLKAKAFCRSDGSVEKVEKFDPYGNKSEEVLYDKSGKLRTGIDGWAAMRWWYDEESRLMSQVSYDEHGKSIERKQYSESGKLVFRQYKHDDNVNPTENAAMYMLLGPQNVPYYDANQTLEEISAILKQ